MISLYQCWSDKHRNQGSEAGAKSDLPDESLSRCYHHSLPGPGAFTDAGLTSYLTEVLLAYNIILSLGVPYTDLTIIYVIKCSPP